MTACAGNTAAHRLPIEEAGHGGATPNGEGPAELCAVRDDDELNPDMFGNSRGVFLKYSYGWQPGS